MQMNRDELLDKLAMELAEWPESKPFPNVILPDGFDLQATQGGWLVGDTDMLFDKHQWLQRRAKLINRPPDSEAPEWATHRSQQPTGEWYFWPQQPGINLGRWAHSAFKVGKAVTPFCYGKIPAGHRWQDTLTEIKPMQRELNPTTSSLTDSQAREYAETTGECSDGKRCGVPPKGGDDAYCADCPNQPTPEEDEAFNAMSAKQEKPREADARMLDAQLMADMKSHGIQAPDILNAAAQHMQDRAATYDKPKGERSMLATVEAFAATTGVSLTEEQGWHFMALLKLVRSQQGDYREDSYEDGAAYFALMGEAAAKERKK